MPDQPPEVPPESGDDAAADADLLDGLRHAVDANTRGSEHMLDMIMTGYDLSGLDVVKAELVEDVSVGEVAGVRSGDGPRLVTFQAGTVTIDLEIRSEAPHIVGHVDGATGGAAFLDQHDHGERCDLDEIGGFEFSLGSARPFRVRVEVGSGVVATDWLLP